MCGIAGILTTDPWSDKLTASLTGMQAALRHRGPDDQGLWVDPAAGVGLTHTRLAILDLSPAGHQPMASPDGRYHIVFNGEIYNFQDLRAELEQEGLSFHTGTDTEVLLQLFHRDRAQMLRKLRGMFAFCIWDQQEQTAFLARDPLGIKPLYLAITPKRLLFASELRPLTSCGLFQPTLNANAVQRYFETGSVPEPLTLANEVTLLEAGQSLTWKPGHTQTHPHPWHLTFSSTFTGDATAHTRAALQHSVRQHFVSDVPVGLFLSGGIDSTVLLALAQATGHQRLSTFAIAVDDPAADESALARRSALHFGAVHHELRLDASNVRPWFADFLHHLDQPSIDGFNTFIVSALARQHGMKVVLSGLGGDELFGGYSSFQKIPTLLRLHPLLSRLPGLYRLLQRGKPQHRRLADFLHSPGGVGDAYSALRGIFSKAEAQTLTRWLTGSETAPVAPPQPLPDLNLGDAISRLELTRYLRNQLLRDSDVMSMAHGLELRVPFVDQELWQQTAMIPAKQRLRGQKSLLTAAVPEIPEWILNQKKRGFLFPYQKWLGSDWGQSLTAAAAGAPTPMPNWYQQWSVFVLKHCIQKLGLSA